MALQVFDIFVGLHFRGDIRIFLFFFLDFQVLWLTFFSLSLGFGGIGVFWGSKLNNESTEVRYHLDGQVRNSCHWRSLQAFWLWSFWTGFSSWKLKVLKRVKLNIINSFVFIGSSERLLIFVICSHFYKITLSIFIAKEVNLFINCNYLA